MKKLASRIIALCMITAMVLPILTACGKAEMDNTEKAKTTGSNDSSTQSATTTVKPLEQYKIIALFPGDTPLDIAEVLNEAEKQVKDTLNIKLDFQFIPWADYGNKVMVKMTAGDDFDLHLNAPWLSMYQMISGKNIMPWDDLLVKYGRDVIKAFPLQMIESNKFDGQIWGIPLGHILSAPKRDRYIIRGDLREKYGMQPIKSWDELEQFFLKVKGNEKNMVPATWNASQYTLFETLDPNYYNFGQISASVLIPFNNDGTVGEIKPIYEYPGFLGMVKMMRRWYQEGILDKDLMSQKDGKGAFISGKAAYSNVDFNDDIKFQAAVPGGKMELADMSPDVKPVSDFKMWNFLCLNANCKDAERVIRWYNWIFEDQSHYDLLQYGIKGKHWVDTGKGTFDLPEGTDAVNNYNFPGYVLLHNPNFNRISNDCSQVYKDDIVFCNNPNNYVKSALVGFTPNYEPIKNEIAKVSAIWAETILVLYAGVVDTDKGLKDAKAKLEAAGYLKIVEEAERQINEFLASKK